MFFARATESSEFLMDYHDMQDLIAEEALYGQPVLEEENDDQVVYNSMCENLFAEIAKQWLDQNGARIVSDLMALSKKPAAKRKSIYLSDEKCPVSPF